MREFARSRDVHRALNRCFRPWAKEAGFRSAGKSVCAFGRPRPDGDGWLRFSVQLSAWGDDWSGNQLTLNGERRAASLNAPLGGGVRLLARLQPEDLRIAEALQWHIVQRIPRPPPEHQIYEWMRLPGSEGEEFRRAFRDAFTHDPTLFRPDRDVWLRYFCVADVEAWGEFLVGRLPTLLDASKEAIPSRAVRMRSTLIIESLPVHTSPDLRGRAR